MLVGIALATPGARLGGVGFGGCAVALQTTRQLPPWPSPSGTGRPGEATICTPSDGARVVWLPKG